MNSRLAQLSGRTPGRLRLLLGFLATVALFLFAVQLLGTATEAVAPLVARVFARNVVGDGAALGLSWLAAYVLANGSVVATLSVSLFTAGVVSTQQLFLMVAGSRLGGAAVVVLVGALDYFQKDRLSVQEAVSLGTLTFVLTHSIFLPATVLGYVALPLVDASGFGAGTATAIESRALSTFDPLTEAVTTAIGPGLSVLLAVALVFGSLSLFDRLLARVDEAALQRHLFTHFRHTWVSFFAGLLITGVATSVAFSLGVVVPLYNRGYVDRDELVPYILGANVGTFFDTVLVAVVLESVTGLVVVLELVAVATLLTLLALVAYDQYRRVVTALDTRLATDRRVFAAFLFALLAVPLAFLVVPLLLR
jgi:sodium-dependent phosphate cotransporter